MSSVETLEPLVWSTTQAAQLLTVSRSTIHVLIKEGRLDYIQIGRRVVIPKVALEKFVAEGGAA